MGHGHVKIKFFTADCLRVFLDRLNAYHPYAYNYPENSADVTPSPRVNIFQCHRFNVSICSRIITREFNERVDEATNFENLARCLLLVSITCVGKMSSPFSFISAKNFYFDFFHEFEYFFRLLL